MAHEEKWLPTDFSIVRYIHRFPYNRPFPSWLEPHLRKRGFVRSFYYGN